MHPIPFWKKIPSLRLVIPLATGILIQNEFCIRPYILICCIVSCLAVLFLFFFVPIRWKYILSPVNGIICCLVVAATGSVVTTRNDILQNKAWFGNQDLNHATYYVTIKDAPVEKANSFRAVADVHWIADKTKKILSSGKLLLYFKKESNIPISGTGMII